MKKIFIISLLLAWGIIPNNDNSPVYQRFNDAGGAQIGSIRKNAAGVAFNTTSDYRLKENVEELDVQKTVQKILSAKPVTYTWKSNGSMDVGFIAHELAEAGFDYAVSGEKDAVDADGKIVPQSVDYGRITPDLMKAVQYLLKENKAMQEQQAQVEAQQKQIDELWRIVKALEQNQEAQ